MKMTKNHQICIQMTKLHHLGIQMNLRRVSFAVTGQLGRIRTIGTWPRGVFAPIIRDPRGVRLTSAPCKTLSGAWFIRSACGWGVLVNIDRGSRAIGHLGRCPRVGVWGRKKGRGVILWQPNHLFFDPLGSKNDSWGGFMSNILPYFGVYHAWKTHYFEVTDPTWQQILKAKSLSGGWDL